MFRMPEKQTGSRTVSVCNSPTLSLTFHQSKILLLFYTFKRKKLRGNAVFTTTAIRIYLASLTHTPFALLDP